jgi:hypothetical protein
MYRRSGRPAAYFPRKKREKEIRWAFPAPHDVLFSKPLQTCTCQREHRKKAETNQAKHSSSGKRITVGTHNMLLLTTGHHLSDFQWSREAGCVFQKVQVIVFKATQTLILHLAAHNAASRHPFLLSSEPTHVPSHLLGQCSKRNLHMLHQFIWRTSNLARACLQYTCDIARFLFLSSPS